MGWPASEIGPVDQVCVHPAGRPMNRGTDNPVEEAPDDAADAGETRPTNAGNATTTDSAATPTSRPDQRLVEQAGTVLEASTR